MILMRHGLLLAALLLAAAACRPPDGPPAKGAPGAAKAGAQGLTEGARQVLVVTAHDWDSPEAELQAFERPEGKGAWKKRGQSVPAVLGRNGLGWGRGLHPEPPAGEPVKEEGDGRAPAGLFALGRAFGSFPPASGKVAVIAMPYLHLKEGTECVDDPASAFYNRIVDREGIEKPDWKSSEKMLEAGPVYSLGLEIGHNLDPVEAGAGSCIFLHPWEDMERGTAGCTGVAVEALERILAWLDPGAGPLLVQLPGGAYETYRFAWRLP